MAFVPVLNSVSYLPGPANIGLVRGDHDSAVLIDSGPGARSGRQVLELMGQQHLHLLAILNTHGHGDHIGGNAFLVQHTGARVLAPLHDGIAMRYPIWGTMCTFSGAEPIREMATPRFDPEPCVVDEVITDVRIEIGGVSIQPVPLPGHTLSHTGYLVDDVLFTGDILAGEEELDHAPISYAYSITQRLASLTKLREVGCGRYVLGHGHVEEDITLLIDRNLAHIERVLEIITSLVTHSPLETNTLFDAVIDRLGIQLRNVREYYTIYPALHAYISHLSNLGRIAPTIQNNRLLWCTSEGS